MFQISRRVDYAVRIMIELGINGEDKTVPARTVARKTDVPKAFLHKIAADLVRAGLVRTYAGPHGGLSLAKPTGEINVLHILEAIEGPVLLNTCLLHPGECPRDRVCAGHGFWNNLQIMLIHQLKQGTLDKLVAESLALRKKPRDYSEIVYLQSTPQPTTTESES